MTQAVKITIALVCIVCLLALCIAPWVDPPETTLKSLQIILLLMASFIAGLFVLAGIPALAWRLLLGMVGFQILRIPDLRLPREKTCVQQC